MEVQSIINQFEAIKNEMFDSFNEHHRMRLQHVAMLLLLDGMIEKFKSIEVLLDKDQSEGISIIHRSLLEASVSLQYILNDSKKFARQRGRAFYFFYRWQSGKKAKNMIAQEPYGIDGSELKAKLLENWQSHDEKRFNDIDSYIGYFKDEYEKYFCIRDETKRKKQLQNWFNQDGTLNSIFDMFCKVDREDDYRAFYAISSMDVHASGAISHGRIKAGQFVINYDVQPVVESTCVLWILRAEQELAEYLTLSNNSNIILQMNIIENNWKNKMGI